MVNRKILIVGPAWIGDMVMAQALFKLLHQQDPEVIIDVLAPAWTQGLLERMPEVRNAIVMPLGHGELQLKKRWQIGVSLRTEGYQQAIVLPNSWKSALVPFAARIPLRTGWARELRFGLINDLRFLNKIKLPLMVQRFLALGLKKNSRIPEHYAMPELAINENSIQQTLAKHKLNKNDQPVLALCPGAEFGPAKRWPSEHYAAIAQEKLAAGWQIWLFGSPKDQPVAIEIQQAVQERCIDLTGKTSLAEAIDLMSLADAVVTNDSGLMHIAAALKRPLVVVYGSSSPKFTPPLSERVKIISLNLACSPCFKRLCPLGHLNCLKQMSPQLVLEALDKLVTA